MNFFVENIYTVILFPLWIFLLIVLGRFFNVVQSRRVISLMTLASTLYGLVFSLCSFVYLLKDPKLVYESYFTFLKIDDYVLNLGVYVDNLSVLMLLVVTTISLVVQLYSSSYMFKDKSFPRFFGYLNLFNFSMLGLILSPNLFQNYVFWELVGVSSYLLIGFWYKKPSASDAAKKAFLMNRIGDCGLLAGTIAVSYFMYQYSNNVSLATVPYSSIGDIGNYLYSYTNDFMFTSICILLLMGAIAKSAQFPLHTWLADAMEGPTPVSALIHSATMVAAGVFLIARLYPIFTLNEPTMHLIAGIGIFTALICAFIAISQNDFKRILAFSTNSQLGLMFMALGLGAYSGGIFHLITHAYFKSMLFLISGIVIQSLRHNQDVRYMGGLRKHSPIVAFAYLIGCLSASGILFSGFYSKEMIVSFLAKNHYYEYFILFLIVAFMTTFYMFRSYFLVFEGKFRGEHLPEKTSTILSVSVLCLLLFTLLLGAIIHSNLSGFLLVNDSISQSKYVFNFEIVSVIISLLGLLSAYLIYGKTQQKPQPRSKSMLYLLSNRKLFFDEIYNLIFVKMFEKVSRILKFVDKYVVDGLVLLSAYFVRAFSWLFAKTQTGNFQSYLTYSVIFLAMFFAALMFAYTVIVNYSLLSGG